MKKRFLMIFCTIAIVSIASKISALGRASRYGFQTEHTSSWSFLEELIVLQPQRSVDAWFGKRGASALIALGTAYLTYLGTKQAFAVTSKHGKILSACAGSGVGIVSYSALQTYLHSQAERNQVTMIMKLWTQIRDRIPHEVWPIMDILYNRWLNDSVLYEGKVDETLSYLKAEIYGRFPSRYKATSESFFTSRNLNVQVRVNLYKIAKESYLMLKELFS